MTQRRYALVTEEGEPIGFVETEEEILEGVPGFNGTTYREIDFNKDISKVDCLWWWNGTEWTERSVKPTEFHNWINGEWAADTELMWEYVRAVRSDKLSKCDWTQLSDTNLTEEEKQAWQVYRTELRDLPSTNIGVDNISEIAWPSPPPSTEE